MNSKSLPYIKCFVVLVVLWKRGKLADVGLKWMRIFLLWKYAFEMDSGAKHVLTGVSDGGMCNIIFCYGNDDGYVCPVFIQLRVRHSQFISNSFVSCLLALDQIRVAATS